MRIIGLVFGDTANVSAEEELNVLRLLSTQAISSADGRLRETLANLETRGLVSQRCERGGYTVFLQPTYEITTAGLAYLREREDRVKDHAENEAKEQAKEHKAERLRIQDTRRSWWQFALGMLLGWILGGFTFREFLALFH